MTEEHEDETLVGKVISCHSVMGFGNIAVVALEHMIKMGDTIRIEGKANFSQKVGRMEANHKVIAQSPETGNVGLILVAQANAGDKVYRMDAATTDGS